MSENLDVHKIAEQLKKIGFLIVKADCQYYGYGELVNTDYERPVIKGDDYVGEKLLNLSDLALEKLLKDYDFETVLDIGCGEGIQSNVFINNGKKVTAIDYGYSDYFKNNKSDKCEKIIDDFNTHSFTTQYDCVWCSHILEHQLNVNLFLKKIHSVLREGGILAITVPPLKHAIVGGHVTLWNAGLILYNLILAGFNCKNASVKTYGYNISVIVQKDTIDVKNIIAYDRGDIRKLKQYFPEKVEWHSNEWDDPFDGRILELNW